MDKRITNNPIFASVANDCERTKEKVFKMLENENLSLDCFMRLDYTDSMFYDDVMSQFQFIGERMDRCLYQCGKRLSEANICVIERSMNDLLSMDHHLEVVFRALVWHWVMQRNFIVKNEWYDFCDLLIKLDYALQIMDNSHDRVVRESAEDAFFGRKGRRRKRFDSKFNREWVEGAHKDMMDDVREVIGFVEEDLRGEKKDLDLELLYRNTFNLYLHSLLADVREVITPLMDEAEELEMPVEKLAGLRIKQLKKGLRDRNEIYVWENDFGMGDEFLHFLIDDEEPGFTFEVFDDYFKTKAMIGLLEELFDDGGNMAGVESGEVRDGEKDVRKVVVDALLPVFNGKEDVTRQFIDAMELYSTNREKATVIQNYWNDGLIREDTTKEKFRQILKKLGLYSASKSTFNDHIDFDKAKRRLF